MKRNVETDITVFGATGFVGRHVCNYLLAAAEAHGFSLRLTLAGRNRIKLEERKAGLAIGNKSIVDLFVADSSDSNKLIEMADRTAVVIATAGPFIRYGTKVVEACAKTGTDYVDITGEITWAGRMRAQFGPIAKKSGARIISLCGFDSVPSDLSIFAAVKSLREACGSDVQIEKGCTWHAAMGAMNGGTLHSALEFPLDIRHCAMSGGRLRLVPFLIDDPMVLVDPKVRHDPIHGSWKDRMAAVEWWNQLPTFDSIVRGGMSLPFFMAPVNSKVVNASAVALKYGPAFTYRERFLPLGFRWTRAFSILSAIPALGFQIALMLGFVVFKIPFVGRKLADFILPPGSGLPDVILEAGHAEVSADVVTKPNASGSVDRATCFVSFEGDPGNLVTAQCVGECGLALVLNRKELPPCSEDGFGTPAELLGDVLLKRLQQSQVRKVQVMTRVRRNTAAKEAMVYK